MNTTKTHTKNLRVAFFTTLSIAVFLVVIFLFTNIRLKNKAVEDSYQTAILVSKEVKHSIEEYFRDALTVSVTKTESFLLYKQNHIPRKLAYNFMKGALEKNTNFLAYWTMWEADAYDKQDYLFRNDSLHDDEGHFAFTYYYYNGEILTEINDTNDYNEEFYTLAAELKKPVILDPYHYQYHGNPKDYYETSFVNPIIVNDTLLGVFGIDIDIQLLQNQFSLLKVYKNGFISILSNSGLIVTHPDSKYVDHKISDFLLSENHFIIDSIKKGAEFSVIQYSEFLNQEVVRFFYPINMEYMVAPWYIMVEIPKTEIFTAAKRIQWISIFILAILLTLLLYLAFILVYDRKNKEMLMQALKQVLASEADLKDAQKVMIENEEKYRAIFNNANDALFLMTGDQFVDCNEMTLKMFRCQRNEIIGKPPYLFSPEFQLDGKRSDEKALEKINAAHNGNPQFFEWTHQTITKELFEAEVSLTKVTIHNLPYLLAIVRNINEKKKAEKELKNYRDKLELMVDERTEALKIANLSLVSSNEELNTLNENLAEQKVTLEATLTKLKQAQNQLIQSEKLASLGVFTAGIAHEINNPINYISGGVSVLLENIKELKTQFANNANLEKLFEEIIFSCHAIETGVQKTTTIISSLRNYSHSGGDVFVKYNSIQCLNDALAILNNTFKFHIQIVKIFPEELIIECIPDKINQVFVNIINNAIQSIQGNGVITITGYQYSQNAIFEIEDNGAGIDPKVMDKIFDPFYTTKEVGKGTGLGLSIVHNIIENHQGTIELKSEPGKGTLVRLILPLKPVQNPS
ncbi:MAG: ATP-binding protein [Salinivirgaceae bacterium]